MITRASRGMRAVREGAAVFFRNHGLVYSAAIAFNLLLSSIPVLFLAFAAAAVVIGKNELPFEQLADLLRNTFPYGARVLVPNLRKLFAAGSAFGAVGTLLLLFSSYSVTDAVHTSLSVMLMRKRKKRHLRSFGFHVAFVIVLILLTAAAIVVPPLWEGLFYLTKGMSAQADWAFKAFLELVSGVALLGTLFLGSVLSYRFLSPGKVLLRHALAGSAIFLALLQCVNFGFRFYIRKFSQLNLLYGSLFSIICFILIAYLFAAAYLYGASVIGVLERTGGETCIPETEKEILEEP
ncbi:MAG: YihY/virulence factor BrkB family protein [Deltaproteobacteria bacterium]|nr:MAG: YihY/virulence factor BrkB family protein [Deltaproteobacteria bacterium]